MAAIASRTSAAGAGAVVGRGCIVTNVAFASDAVGAGNVLLREFNAAGAILLEIRVTAANRSKNVRFKGFKVQRTLWVGAIANGTVFVEYE